MHASGKAALSLAALAVAGLAAAQPAHAALSFVTSQAALSGTDFIDWSSYGVYSLADNFPSDYTFQTHNGVGFSVQYPLVDPTGTNAGLVFDPRGPIELHDPTDFAPGTSALRNVTPSNGTITDGITRINFLTPASAVGAQVENRNANHDIGPTFTGYVSAFDGSTLLGTFSETNTIQNLQDGSAPFLGVVSDTADITSVEYSVTQNNEFFIGPVSLRATPLAASPAVPEPGSLSLLGLGLGGVALAARRRRRA